MRCGHGEVGPTADHHHLVSGSVRESAQLKQQSLQSEQCPAEPLLPVWPLLQVSTVLGAVGLFTASQPQLRGPITPL